MRAWRFYGFGDMRLDDVPEPVCRPGHVIVEPLCVQPSVTEAQLAFGVRTLAYEKIKHRIETEAPVQLFGHEFSARIVEVADDVIGFSPGDRVVINPSIEHDGRISVIGEHSDGTHAELLPVPASNVESTWLP